MTECSHSFTMDKRLSGILLTVPQGSVLGPVKFAAYTEDIIDLIERHGVRSHLCADDTQLYDRCKLDGVPEIQSRLSGCVSEVAQWCASRRLQPVSYTHLTLPTILRV